MLELLYRVRANRPNTVLQNPPLPDGDNSGFCVSNPLSALTLAAIGTLFLT
jgi:hypothetical protein